MRNDIEERAESLVGYKSFDHNFILNPENTIVGLCAQAGMSRIAWHLPSSTFGLPTAYSFFLAPARERLLNMAGYPWGHMNQDGSHQPSYPYSTAAHPAAGVRTTLETQMQPTYAAYGQQYQQPGTVGVAHASQPIYDYSYGDASTRWAQGATTLQQEGMLTGLSNYMQAGTHPAYQASGMYMQHGYVPTTAAQPYSSPQPQQSQISHAETSSSHYDEEAIQAEPLKELRCWDHGCNGRAFSTHSNLLRHQREKSGNSMKFTCPKCGAQFTRNTAMKAHMDDDKCGKKRGTSSSHRRSP